MSESQDTNSGDPTNGWVQAQPGNTPKPSEHFHRDDLLWVLFDPPGRLEEGSHVMYAVSSEIRGRYMVNKCASKGILFSLTVANRYALDLFLQEMEGPFCYMWETEIIPFFQRVKDAEHKHGAGEIKWNISDIGELSLWATDDDGETRTVWVQRHVIQGDRPDPRAIRVTQETQDSRRPFKGTTNNDSWGPL